MIQRYILHSIPVAILYKGDLETAANKGCILCYHGLTSSKDDWLHDLEMIAEKGFVVVGVDNVGHGERKDPYFYHKYSQDNPAFWKNFVSAIQATACEISLLIDELIKRGFALEDRIGGLGVSMGGLVLYSAILLEPRLSTVVTLVSSPQWWELEHPDSPHHHLEKFARVHLLSITAGQDTTVPNTYTKVFHKRLQAHFADYEQHFVHQDYPLSNHMLEPDWHEAWITAIRWFETHLADQASSRLKINAIQPNRHSPLVLLEKQDILKMLDFAA